MPERKKRPVFLNLARIHLPVTAVLSIGHRLSGVLLIIALPLMIYLLDISLRSAEGYSRAADLLNAYPLRLLAVLLIWALAHHVFAGIRFLLLDIKLGMDRTVARRTAWWVHVAGVVVLILAAGTLLL